MTDADAGALSGQCEHFFTNAAASPETDASPDTLGRALGALRGLPERPGRHVSGGRGGHEFYAR